MQYIGQFCYWLIIICAIVVTIKGLFIICAKRAIYPRDIFKEISVTNVRKYNILNGILLIGLGGVFAVVALVFRYGSFNMLYIILLIGISITGTILEKRVENNYLVTK